MSIRVISKPLFKNGYLSEYLDKRREAVIGHILTMTNIAVLEDSIVQKFRISTLSIDIQDIEADCEPQEATINTVGPNPYISFENIPVKGKILELSVPFNGDYTLLDFAPQHSLHSKGTRAELAERNTRIKMRIETAGEDPSDVNRLCKEEFEGLQQNLQMLSVQILEFNSSLSALVQSHMAVRRAELKKADSFKQGLKFPIRRRNNAPVPAAIPTIRRNPETKITLNELHPYYSLELPEYENILKIIHNMSRVLECSPSYFAGVDEETLRFHFLVQLNGQYSGETSAEAFNFNGKTDILIQREEKIVFIAECKFWTGPKGFHETVEQLFGYLSWRESKAAIIIFNKNKNISTVTEQIPTLLEANAQFKRKETLSLPMGQYRCVLAHPRDPEIELTLTTLVFDIPSRL